MDALLVELRGFVPRGGSRWPARAAWLSAIGVTAAQAESARRRGQDAEAATLFEQVLARAPRNSTALAALSDIAFDRGEHEAAARYARQAIQADPEIAEYHARLGDALVKLRRRGEAAASYERALELGDARAHRRIELLSKGGLG